MTSEQPKTKSSSKLIVRIIVFGTLAILLILALLDFQKKNAALESYSKIQSVMDERLAADKDIRWTDIEQVVIGNPAVSEGELGSDSFRARSRKVMTWNGIFKSHSVDVLLGLGGADAFVVEVSASWEVPAGAE